MAYAGCLQHYLHHKYKCTFFQQVSFPLPSFFYSPNYQASTMNYVLSTNHQPSKKKDQPITQLIFFVHVSL